MPDVGYYTLPVILSFEGVDKQVNSKLGKAFEGIGKKAGKDAGKGLGDGLKSTEADVKKATDAYSKLRDKAADALGKVRVEEEKLAKARSSGKADMIVAAEERLSKARRDSSRATRDAHDSHTVLLSTQKKLGDGTADLGGKFGGLKTAAAGAGTALAGAGAIAGGVALAGVTALAAGVVVAGNRLYELGAQFDDLSDNLQVKTGLSGAALDELKSSVERLGTTNVPSTFGEIGDVAAEVTRNLHLTGSSFDEVTSRLANLQRMGVDVDIRTLGKAFRGFGVDAKDQAPALNALYEASTKSGLSIDDMTAAVAKGGPALRQLGLDFGESAALIATFEEAGLDGEKGMVALNKAFAYFSKEGIPAEQGLRDIVTQIQALGDTPQAGELANKVFGAKGGAAFLEAIQTGALDLQSLSDSLQTTGVDINKVSDDTADWTEKWQDLKNEVSVALEPLAGGFFDGINAELGKAADWIVENKGVIIDAFTAIADGIITFAEVSVRSFGLFTEGLGQLIAPIGDVLGAVNDFQAWQADIRGDTDTAASLRAQAQEFYGMGEGLTAVGRAAKDPDFQALRDSLHNIANEAKNAAGGAGDLDVGIGKLAGRTIDLKTTVNGQPTDLPSWFAGVNGGGTGNPTGQNPLDVIAPTGPGFTMGGPGAPQLGGGGNSFGAASLPPLSGESARDFAHRARKPLFEAQGLTVGDHAADQYGEHQNGALDIMVPNIAKGEQVLQQVLADPDTYGAIFNGQSYGYGHGLTPKPYTGPNPHTDHVHVWYKPGAGMGGGTTAPSQTVRKSSGTTSMLNNQTAPPTAPSGGTPGFNEYGEPGYYETDPKAVRQAQQSIADADERVKRADQAAAEAEARLAELDVDASESSRLSAQNSLENAKADAAKARREAADARTDAEETARGDFKAAKEAKDQTTGKSGVGDLSPLGAIAGSFLKETFGFDGSLFPDIASLAPVQMAGNLLSAFSGPLKGAMEGKLGIQQPGWSPGMPVSDTTSFGMPNVAAPPMPAPGVHGGSGAPPGPGGVTIDASQTFNGTVGMDPVQIQKQQRDAAWRGLVRIP